MSDHPNRADYPQNRAPAAFGAADPVGALAGQALSVVAKRPDALMPCLDDEWIRLLSEACMNGDGEAAGAVIDRMRDAGLRACDIAEHYIPACARLMGDQWCEDDASFARVTIGCSRLHGILRALGPYWTPAGPISADATSVLVLVGEDIYHTLGPTVLAGVLRRKGYAVKLWVGARPSEIAGRLQDSDYDAVLISASSGESLETVRRFVAAARGALEEPPLIFVGGTITCDGQTDAEDIQALTGADHVTNDPLEALKLCANSISPGRSQRSKSSVSFRQI